MQSHKLDKIATRFILSNLPPYVTQTVGRIPRLHESDGRIGFCVWENFPPLTYPRVSAVQAVVSVERFSPLTYPRVTAV
ncbi:hypothetical protein DPMN_040672 [Dreissena polymorpha]|uniref:Uncharacterized protein n=1 Tax=Dreissena polymorpha TaxID=45954 RepID=A0A9D4CVG9_DREPO|nr:hypothetical protein DPMN_040672 [Dreissena polymorpha]